MTCEPFLSPDCDINYLQFIEDVDIDTGELAPVTDGEIEVFIGDWAGADEPADDTLVGGSSHIGVASPVGDQKALGWWLHRMDGVLLTREVLRPLFGVDAPTEKTLDDDTVVEVAPYLVVVRVGDFRRVVKLRYVDGIPAEFAEA